MTSKNHSMFPTATHDENAQQDFVRSLMSHLYEEVMPGNRLLYDNHVVPQYLKDKGRPPNGRSEVRRALESEPYNQMWASLMRTSQEMMYTAVRPSIERQMPELKQRARALGSQLGSVTIDPDFQMPAYHTKVDIHCKPGAYHAQLDAEDFLAGAEFDRTIMLYFQGVTGPLCDDIGRSMGVWIQQQYGDLKPLRILDMGCTIGHNSLPYAELYPDAEVHAIDVAEPCLLYGHYRAEALGQGVHFSQQNAEKTNFADGSFDLIVSHTMLHETSHKAAPRIIKECHRLLRTGGLVLHMDSFGMSDPYYKYLNEWNALYNNEPYMGKVVDEDFAAMFDAAGFSQAAFFQQQIPSLLMPKRDANESGKTLGIGYYHAIGARK